MKFDNKLNLKDYFQVINDIVGQYFNEETNEYTPQFGEAYALCTFFNLCVELEDKDEIKKQPIDDIMDMQSLYDCDELMQEFWDEIDGYGSLSHSLTFGNAYQKAMEIVDFKKNDANSFATAISASFDAILKSFRESFSDDTINNFTEIAQNIADGKLSEEAIIKAYDNSDRFKENTESAKIDK